MALIQTVHLSMANFKSAPVVPAVQNDTDRQVKMILDDYTLTSGLTGKIAFERSDGTHYETAAELVLADNAFVADIDQALTQPGRTMVQLKVTDTLTVSTFSFVIFVEADNSGTVTPQEGIDLVAAVASAEDAADRAESAAEDAEAAADTVDVSPIWATINTNFYGGNRFLSGKKINASRQIVDDDNYCVTDYFGVVPSQTITIYCNASSATTLYGLEYAEDGTIIERWGFTAETRTFTLSSSAKYFRFTFPSGYAAKAEQNGELRYYAVTNNGIVSDAIDLNIDALHKSIEIDINGGIRYTPGKKINASRQIVNDEAYCVTDFFEVDPTKQVTIYCNASSSNVLYGLEYDANKSITDRWGISAEYRTFSFTSANAKYFRFTFPVGYEARATQNGVDIYVANVDGIKKDVLAEVPAVVEETISTIGLNKFNPNTTENGYIDNDSGNVTSSDSYFTSDFIDVSAFTHGYAFSPKARKLIFFDANKTAIAASYHNDETAAGVIELNAAYKFVRFSWYYTSTDIIVADADSVPAYEPYEIIARDGINYMNTDTERAVKEITGGGLRGKKWAVCGDSFTAGADSGTIPDGKYAGQNIVYPYIIGNRTGIDVLNFFQNGRTLAFPETPGDFVNSLTCPTQAYYYQNIPVDVDYITIYLGINDEHHATGDSVGDGEDTTGVIPIGTISDANTTTYYGAWNVVLTWLITNRPFAHIGIIVTNGVSAPYREAQIAIAKKYGIPYIDMNGDKQTPCMIRSCNADVDATVRAAIQLKQAVNYPTNTHPNNATHEYESTFIEAFLKSI